MTAEMIRTMFEYDSATGILRWLIPANRRTASIGSNAGYTNSRGYVRVGIDGKNYYAHRLAWLYVYGKWPTYQIDHINGDTTDNRIENLRDIPGAMNMQNIKTARKKNKTGFLGVYKDSAKRNLCWKASIRINGKPVTVGHFASPEEAHAAYIAAKRRFHDGCTI
jgi:hypothetical protein